MGLFDGFNDLRHGLREVEFGDIHCTNVFEGKKDKIQENNYQYI